MASPPSPASSAASDGDAPDHRPPMNPSDPPSLEDLIQHFVAAKRSLNTQTELWRAGEIVNAARGLLEENAILAAKNASIRNIVDEQVDALEAIRRGIDVVDAEVHAEFQQLLHDLDVSFTGLNSTLDVLRDTPIEAVLQPAGTPQKHLYDFIDSTTITNLKDALHACIDRYNESRSALNDTSDAFDTALENLYSSIENVPMTPATTSNPSPIPRLYQELEGHAKEAAQCFQSLVRHYDLCVSALRHTEGGAAAATQATGDAPLSSAEDLYAAPEPMTEEERREMISVLQKDALEVEDVVTEIRERKSEMEFLLNHIQAHINHLRNEDSALHSILRMIAHVASEAKGHIITSRSFQTSYMEDTRPTLLNGIEEWENQREFYERFDLAYAELLVEISARRRRHEKAKRKAEDAQRELDRLHAEDERAREQFTLTQGDFLPLDIWPGLRDPPRKYAVRAVVIPQDEQGEEDPDAVPEVTDGGVQSIPQLGRNVVERALTRVKRRM